MAISLAAGIGASLSALNLAYLTRYGPLPYPNPKQVVVTTAGEGFLVEPYYGWQLNPRASGIFRSLAEYHLEPDFLETGSTPQPWTVACVTSGFFNILGRRMELGAGLPIAAPLPPGKQAFWEPIVLSNQAWRNYFHADRKIIGHEIDLTRLYPFRFQVVGVAPQWVRFPSNVDGWIPEYMTSSRTVQWAGTPNWMTGEIGRLRPGITVREAAAAIHAWPATPLFAGSGRDVQIEPIRKLLGGNLYRLASWLWAIAVLFLLLAVAASLSIYSYETGRRGVETQIRRALGATPALLLFANLQDLLLAFLPALAAAVALGVATARLTASYFEAFQTGAPVIWRTDVAAGAAVLALTAALAVAAHARQTGARAEGALARKWRRTRVPWQVIPATLILTVVVALGRGAVALRRIASGVNVHGAFVCEVALPMSAGRFEAKGIPSSLPEAAQNRMWVAGIARFNSLANFDFSTVEDRIRVTPGVESVGLISNAPYSGYPVSETGISVSRSPGRSRSVPLAIHLISVDPKALPALGIPLVYGRNFTQTDRDAVVVNEAAAHLIGPGASAVGQFLNQGFPGAPWDRIIGVVGNVHEKDLLSPVIPTAYLQSTAVGLTDVDLVIKATGAGGSRALYDAVKSAAAAVAPGAVVSRFAPLADMVASAARPALFAAESLLALAVAGLAMVGACVWTACAAELRRREHETGVRLALGAQPNLLVRLFVARYCAACLATSALAALLAWWSSRLFGHFWAGGALGPGDCVAAVVVVEAVALSVSYVVARAVARRDPRGLLGAGS
ncbi:MAG: FtsX-like permease family protein [Terriglobales bacterium]